MTQIKRLIKQGKEVLLAIATFTSYNINEGSGNAFTNYSVLLDSEIKRSNPIELQFLKLIAVYTLYIVKSSTRIVPEVEGCQQKTGDKVIDVARRVDIYINRIYYSLVDIDGDACTGNSREKKTNVRLVLNVIGDSILYNERRDINFLTFYTILGELLLVLDDRPILSYIAGLEEAKKSFLGIISIIVATYSVDDLGRNANARARRFILELFDILRFLGNSTNWTENIDGIDVILVQKRGNLLNQWDSPKGSHLSGLITLIFFSTTNNNDVLVLLLISILL